MASSQDSPGTLGLPQDNVGDNVKKVKKLEVVIDLPKMSKETRKDIAHRVGTALEGLGNIERNSVQTPIDRGALVIRWRMVKPVSQNEAKRLRAGVRQTYNNAKSKMAEQATENEARLAASKQCSIERRSKGRRARTAV